MKHILRFSILLGLALSASASASASSQSCYVLPAEIQGQSADLTGYKVAIENVPASYTPPPPDPVSPEGIFHPAFTIWGYRVDATLPVAYKTRVLEVAANGDITVVSEQLLEKDFSYRGETAPDSGGLSEADVAGRSRRQVVLKARAYFEALKPYACPDDDDVAADAMKRAQIAADEARMEKHDNDKTAKQALDAKNKTVIARSDAGAKLPLKRGPTATGI